jgi:hypothetical protein
VSAIGRPSQSQLGAARVDRERPLSASLSVEQARDAYLAENGFSVEAYDDRWTSATLLGIRFHVPNTRRHRWAIMLHDLHHAATGYGTDFVGEAETSAWECRAGLRHLGLYTGAIVLGLALAGLAVAPARTLRAWRSSRGASLFQDPQRDYGEILALSLADLRGGLGLPEAGLANLPRRLHAGAPAVSAP